MFPMFLQIQANNAETARLAELRDTLLSRPMSGELSFDVTFSKMRGRYYADIL